MRNHHFIAISIHFHMVSDWHRAVVHLHAWKTMENQGSCANSARSSSSRRRYPSSSPHKRRQQAAKERSKEPRP